MKNFIVVRYPENGKTSVRVLENSTELNEFTSRLSDSSVFTFNVSVFDIPETCLELETLLKSKNNE